MRAWLFACLPASAALAVGLQAAPAAAQVNKDLGLSVGAMKRFTTGAETSDEGFGPVAQLQAHVALFPMIRAGLYVAYDHNSIPNAGQRNYVTGGLHLKLTPPLLSSPWKLYFAAGFGGGYAEADSYVGPTGASPPTTPYGQLTGGLLEVPLAIGLARKLSGPWELFVELGGRFGVAFFGGIYDTENTAQASTTIPNSQLPSAGYTGQDSFALSLSVGVSLSD